MDILRLADCVNDPSPEGGISVTLTELNNTCTMTYGRETDINNKHHREAQHNYRF